MNKPDQYPCGADYYAWKDNAMQPEAKCHNSRPAYAHQNIRSHNCMKCPFLKAWTERKLAQSAVLLGIRNFN